MQTKREVRSRLTIGRGPSGESSERTSTWGIAVPEVAATRKPRMTGEIMDFIFSVFGSSRFDWESDVSFLYDNEDK